ncbi:MAG: polysaccharide deacetylase [Geobacteraceae bacterium GWC2_58_44]|nr:MAG: polysaccharide deacetylase [Geobacteraceae bacterium GWC2_58_44]
MNVSGVCHAARITEYRVIRKTVQDQQGKTRVAIRSFKSDQVAHLLVVDPVTLTSSNLPASTLGFSDASEASLGSTRFMKALDRHSLAPYRLQNGGATRAESAVEGVFLTVDLCPSKRPFERELFDAAGALCNGTPVPVAVAVSGVWLANHPEELSYLKGETAAGRLAITWVNHSYHHDYHPQAPLEQNFLLTPGTDMSAEVIDLEQQLLANGLVPSPFFRFPGLVSDQAAMSRLRELSLIPIGSDAWLAKGESPRKGSFILVHGNGNEPKGVRLLLPMLRSKELRLLPLPEAFLKAD